MQVEYYAEGRSLVVFRQGPVAFCCTEMCRWWGVLVGFGVRGHAATTSRTVNLFLSRPQANGPQVLEVVPVDYCPWCGEVVHVCRAARLKRIRAGRNAIA
jgi:hypothetical protein